MVHILIAMIAVMLLLAACSGKKADDRWPQSNGPGQEVRVGDTSVRAQVSGDREAEIRYVGNGSGVGLMPMGDRAVIQITGGTDYDAAEQASVSLMVFAPSLSELMQHGGTGGSDLTSGSVRLTPVDGIGEFESRLFPDFFAAAPKATPVNVHIDKITEVAGDILSQRYHVAGEFDFRAAGHPTPLSAACLKEAEIAGAAGRRPKYNAALCGARQVSVRGRFDGVAAIMKPM
ncbi:hypothetical protein ACSBM8_13840 [Sphingomonas sp. ASY06-1R]|uniref:hypothetical protein n=1 Tax=Sphingomonas sp. ASY06-1R TaxID=3445771 RepID=UPI003FA212F4